MTTMTVAGADATHENISHLPPGQVAGYVTGSGGVPWTEDDFRQHPGAVRIDQTPASTQWDATADVDDYEKGAVTLAELAPRARLRKAAFIAGIRPGQRHPAIYVSRSKVTEVVNALIAGGVSSGVGLWIADWDDNEQKAIDEVAHASGPFPVIARQYTNAGTHDLDVFSSAWLADVSASPAVKVVPHAPPGPWLDPHAWDWKEVTIIGRGLNDGLFAFSYDPDTGRWTKVAGI